LYLPLLPAIDDKTVERPEVARYLWATVRTVLVAFASWPGMKALDDPETRSERTHETYTTYISR
jgi:hypothetical protein